jgi:hypothetical protein
MDNFIYFPIIKTRDAELKCMSNIDPETFDKILPIYELTKSRKTSKTPDGDIHRRMNVIGDIQGKKEFILDVCTLPAYINPQIEQLIDEADGYHYWRYFLSLYSDLNIIPMIHLYDDEDFTEVNNFIRHVSQLYPRLCLRLPYDVDNIKNYVVNISRFLSNNCKLILVFDGDFLQLDPVYGINDIVDNFVTACSEVSDIPNIDCIVIAGTSFPKSVAPYGDKEGIFDILEEKVYQAVREEYDVKYGDYASINTEQIEVRGGTFIPRIDISLDEKFIYKRNRREQGSYVLCAQEMLGDSRYHSLSCWADREILTTSQGEPNGRSPSFWIAARMNYFMTSRVLLRRAD